MLQRGKSCVVWFVVSNLYRYDVRKGDLFVLSCADFSVAEVGSDCCGVNAF